MKQFTNLVAAAILQQIKLTKEHRNEKDEAQSRSKPAVLALMDDPASKRIPLQLPFMPIPPADFWKMYEYKMEQYLISLNSAFDRLNDNNSAAINTELGLGVVDPEAPKVTQSRP